MSKESALNYTDWLLCADRFKWLIKSDLGLLPFKGCSMKQFKTPRLLVKAGDASYSAYLIHMKIYLWYGRLFSLTHLGGTVFVLSSIVVCLAVSIVFYNVFERNLTLWVSKVFF